MLNNYTMSEPGLALLRQFEGFSPAAYICPAGKRTIGYGHVIMAGEEFPETGISENQANLLLKHDVNKAEQAICRLVTVSLKQCQFDALVCFAYNVGNQAFENSTLLRLLNAGNLGAAAGQFSRWAYAGGRKIPGLAARRAAETALFTADT